MGATNRSEAIAKYNRTIDKIDYQKAKFANRVSSETFELLEKEIQNAIDDEKFDKFDTYAIFDEVVSECDEAWKKDRREFLLRKILSLTKSAMTYKADIEKY